MAFNPQSFVNPSEFGDYSYYMGVKPTDQLVGLSEQMGAKPPESIGDYAQQAIQPIQNKLSSIQNAATSLSQGNIGQAYKGYKGQQTTQPSQTDDGFDHNW